MATQSPLDDLKAAAAGGSAGRAALWILSL